jgi:hypothetical protein
MSVVCFAQIGICSRVSAVFCPTVQSEAQQSISCMHLKGEKVMMSRSGSLYLCMLSEHTCV